MSFINRKENESLKKYSSFKTGGTCRYFFDIKDTQALESILTWNKKGENLPIRVIGEGKNILFAEGAINIIIIRFSPLPPTHNYSNDSSGTLTLSAGTSLTEGIVYAMHHNLFGLEELSGIPASIGGALTTNAHYFEYSVGNFVKSGEIYDTKEKKIFTASQEWFQFAPYESRLKNNTRYIVLEATFLLDKKDNFYKAYARGRAEEIVRHRNYRYQKENTCGLFFKHIKESEAPLINNKKERAAAFYIAQCDLSSIPQFPHTFLSKQNPNSITHDGKGTTTEIIAIARFLQEKVFETWGILLESDCECIGFTSYPLHTQKKRLF
jgi:UDP-N-acetylmuramate dehydrogenase